MNTQDIKDLGYFHLKLEDTLYVEGTDKIFHRHPELKSYLEIRVTSDNRFFDLDSDIEFTTIEEVKKVLAYEHILFNELDKIILYQKEKLLEAMLPFLVVDKIDNFPQLDIKQYLGVQKKYDIDYNDSIIVNIRPFIIHLQKNIEKSKIK